MERFVLFFRGGTESPSEDGLPQWLSSLKDRGILLEAASLTRDGKRVFPDRVQEFVFDIEEHARGFSIIKTDNLAEAESLARSCPILSTGGNVTIRPMAEN